jgi:L-fucose isomerase-like protein
MKNKFCYIPLFSKFIDSEEKLERISGDYFNFLSSKGGIKITKADIDNPLPLVYFIVTGGTEQQLIDLLNVRSKVFPKEPVYIIAHPTQNSLPASLEILAKCHQDKIEGEIFYFKTSNDEDGILQIENALESQQEITTLHNLRIGMVGEPSDWLIASKPAAEIIKNVWGPEVINLNIEEVAKELENIIQVDVEKTHNMLISNADEIIEPSKLDIENNVRVYLALKNIIDKNKLDALSIRCFDLLLDIKTSGCFALAKLNDEGIIAGCEGDLVSTVSMLWVYKLLDQIPWMANPAQINAANNSLLLAHCTVPLSLVSSYDLRSHFESGISVGIKGTFSKELVTLLRIGGKDMRRIWLAEGEIVKTGNSEHLCRTQLEIKLNRGNVKELLSSPLGNHIILLKGNKADQLMKWWKININQD